MEPWFYADDSPDAPAAFAKLVSLIGVVFGCPSHYNLQDCKYSVARPGCKVELMVDEPLPFGLPFFFAVYST